MTWLRRWLVRRLAPGQVAGLEIQVNMLEAKNLALRTHLDTVELERDLLRQTVEFYKAQAEYMTRMYATRSAGLDAPVKT